MTDSPTRPGRERLAFWLILLAGAAIRLFRLGHQSLWWDEAWQFHVATAGGARQMLEKLLDPSVAAHPPLSHLVSALFLQLGRTDAMLRLPSVIFGVAALVVCFLLVRRVFSTRPALWAMALMAFSPFHLHYSQEGRMYAQLMLLSLGSTALLIRAVDRSTRFRWALYTVSIVAAIYTHVYASLGILAQAIWIVAVRRDRLRPFLVAGVASVVAFAPMVAFFLQRVSTARVPFGGAGSTLAALPYSLFVYAVGFSLGPSVLELREDRGADVLVQHWPVLAGVLLLFGALLVLGLWIAPRVSRDRRAAGLLVLSLAVPVLGVFAASFLPRMTYNVRYTAWAFPCFIALIGLAVAWLTERRRLVGGLVVAGIAALWAVSMLNHFTNPAYAKEDVRSAVAYWRSRSHGEAVLSYNGFPTIDRYMTPREIPLHHAIWRRARTAERIEAVMEETGSRDRAFLILARDWHHIVETLARERFRVLDEREFPGGVKVLEIAGRSGSEVRPDSP